jgi:hypothetical protein
MFIKFTIYEADSQLNITSIKRINIARNGVKSNKMPSLCVFGGLLGMDAAFLAFLSAKLPSKRLCPKSH